jgi:hypothetical protein
MNGEICDERRRLVHGDIYQPVAAAGRGPEFIFLETSGAASEETPRCEDPPFPYDVWGWICAPFLSGKVPGRTLRADAYLAALGYGPRQVRWRRRFAAGGLWWNFIWGKWRRLDLSNVCFGYGCNTLLAFPLLALLLLFSRGTFLAPYAEGLLTLDSFLAVPFLALLWLRRQRLRPRESRSEPRGFRGV